MDTLQFQPVTSEEDAAIAASLARTIWTEHYSPIIGREQVNYMLEKFQSPGAIMTQMEQGALYYLMRENSAPVGYLAVQQKGSDLFLSKIYVTAPLRGKGRGRRAMLFIERLARMRGLRKIFLTVNRNNTGAVKAYERMGFRTVEAVVQDIGGGFVMDDFRMEKTVAQPER